MVLQIFLFSGSIYKLVNGLVYLISLGKILFEERRGILGGNV